MLPCDGVRLIASKNCLDVADVFTAIRVPSGCYPAVAPVPSPKIAMATVPMPSRRAVALQPLCNGAHGVCIKGSIHAFQMHNRQLDTGE